MRIVALSGTVICALGDEGKKHQDPKKRLWRLHVHDPKTPPPDLAFQDLL